MKLVYKVNPTDDLELSRCSSGGVALSVAYPRMLYYTILYSALYSHEESFVDVQTGRCLKKSLNASRPSKHPGQGGKCQNA